VRPDRFWQWRRNKEMSNGQIFEGWHNIRYFSQCYNNLAEKYDCGGITKEEWIILQKFFNKYAITQFSH
jgi:hypothetical protein